MNFSYNLLKKFISIPWENLEKTINDNWINIKIIKDRKFPETMVIWKSIKIERHPNADRLFVCQIDCGTHWIFQILTWGENIKEWVYLPIALPWTYLSEINIKIESRKMRWVESNWMICSKQEMWIDEDSDKHWIWILDEDFDDLSDEDLGKKISDKYPWMENIIFKLENEKFNEFFDSHFKLWLLLNLITSQNKERIKYNKIPLILDMIYHTNMQELLTNASCCSKEYNLDINNYIAIELWNLKIVRTHFYNRVNLIDLWYTPSKNIEDFINIFDGIYWYKLKLNQPLSEIWNNQDKILIINDIENKKYKLYTSISIIDEIKSHTRDLQYDQIIWIQWKIDDINIFSWKPEKYNEDELTQLLIK